MLSALCRVHGVMTEVSSSELHTNYFLMNAGWHIDYNTRPITQRLRVEDMLEAVTLWRP